MVWKLIFFIQDTLLLYILAKYCAVNFFLTVFLFYQNRINTFPRFRYWFEITRRIYYCSFTQLSIVYYLRICKVMVKFVKKELKAQYRVSVFLIYILLTWFYPMIVMLLLISIKLFAYKTKAHSREAGIAPKQLERAHFTLIKLQNW